MIPHLTTTQIVMAIREVAAEVPSYFSYAKEPGKLCQYVDRNEDGTPNHKGCIVGQAMKRLGVPLEVFIEDISALDLMDALSVSTIASQDRDWIDDVQGSQDGGTTWHSAVWNADNRYHNTSDKE